MDISKEVKTQITFEKYSSCWGVNSCPDFDLFMEHTVKAFEMVIPESAESLEVTIDSATENRIQMGDSFFLDGKKQKIWGEIVWVPKPKFFRGKPGYTEVKEEVIPEDRSTGFTRVSETVRELNGYGEDLVVPPKKLIDTFGLPDKADNFKVSGIYVFEGNAGTAYRLNDYEATTLYWDQSKYPEAISPGEFWDQEESYCFSLVGNANPQAIKSWILKQVGNT